MVVYRHPSLRLLLYVAHARILQSEEHVFVADQFSMLQYDINKSLKFADYRIG